MYSELERPPLTSVRPGPWREVRVLEQTASTNEVVAQAARSGEPEGLVVVAEHQSGGRGRQGRSWLQSPRAGLNVSVLLRPPGTPAGWGWLPLAAGLAVCAALDDVAGVRALLKWPNDVLLGERKVAGVLCEVAHGALVVGVGVNVTSRIEELPEGGTSLALERASTTDRALVLRALLRSLHGAVALWGSDPDALRRAYLGRSATLGREVAVHLPGGQVREGHVDDIDTTGCIVVAGVAYAAGDVVHLR